MTRSDVARPTSASDSSVRRGASKLRDRSATGLAPIIALGVIFVGWELITRVGGIEEYILPPPDQVIWKMFVDWRDFWDAGQSTVVAIIIGFVVAVGVALPSAILMIYSKWLRGGIYPLLVTAHLIPKVAIAPLMIIWFGFGQEPKIMMVALISFFPIVVDALTGFGSTRPELLMLVRSMGASRWQAFWRIRLPGALPSIFAGAKVGITLAVVGAVVAEFVGSDQGLGVVLNEARGSLDSVTAFAAIAWLTVVGSIFFVIVSMLERVVTPGHRTGRKHEGAGNL